MSWFADLSFDEGRPGLLLRNNWLLVKVGKHALADLLDGEILNSLLTRERRELNIWLRIASQVDAQLSLPQFSFYPGQQRFATWGNHRLRLLRKRLWFNAKVLFGCLGSNCSYQLGFFLNF